MTLDDLMAEQHDPFTNWHHVGSVPEQHAEVFIRALAEQFPDHTVGLLHWLDGGEPMPDEPVWLRIRPALRPLQLASWQSVFLHLARRHGVELGCRHN